MGTNVKMKATAYLRTEGTLAYYMHTAILCTLLGSHVLLYLYKS
jgi:hypothetical protein